MKYVSPFHLLPERDIFTLNDNDVKRWKKELLLQFDLNQSSVISMNDKEYDKNTVIEAFDKLKEHPDDHIKLYHNKPLLKFIEEGDTGFFSGFKNYTHFVDKPFRDWIAPFFIPQYDEAVYQLIASEERESFHTLNKICNSKFPFPEEWEQEKAYEKAHRFLIDFMEKADNVVSGNTAFIARENFKRKLNIVPDVLQYVDWNLAQKLHTLPTIFEQIRHVYGLLTQEIIEKAYHLDEKVKTPTDDALEVLKDAHRIHVLMHEGKSELEIQPGDFINGVVGYIGLQVNFIVFMLVSFFIVLPIVGYLLLQLLSYFLGAG